MQPRNKVITQSESTRAVIDAELAIIEEVRKKQLEYAELSPTMRELLASVYIRGSIEAIEKLKKTQNKPLDNS